MGKGWVRRGLYRWTARLEQADISGFGLVNAVTGFAQQVDDYDRSTELEAIGGRMLDQSRVEWASLAEAQ